MKYKLLVKVLLLSLLTQFAGFETIAQLNCDGVTNMYGIFIDQNRNSGDTYISPITYAGVIGTALGGATPFIVPPAGTGGGNNAFGSTTLATEPGTNRLFYLTGDYNMKDIYGINATAPGTKVKVSDDMGAAVNSYWFVKLAMSTDGYGYSLSTKRVSPLSDTVNGDTKLIRFNSCMTAGCAVTQVMARIPKASFDPFDLYNGDIAFDVLGDMYIFGSELDPRTNKYRGSGIYRIRKADIPLVPGTTNIPITKLGGIPAMDSLSITGVAFDGSGNFYLSGLDTVTGRRDRSHIFRGSVIGPNTAVTRIYMNVIPNFIIGDLASCAYPFIMLVDAAVAKLNGFNKDGSNALVWKADGVSNIKNFVVERQLQNENEFKGIAHVQASDQLVEYNFNDNIQLLTAASSSYRIRFEKKDGSVIYSNTIQINTTDKAKTKVLVTGNPFKQRLQFDLTTFAPGVKNIVVFDNNGFVVLREKITVGTGMSKVVLDKTSNLKRGIYVLHVFDETNSQQFKVIKD